MAGALGSPSACAASEPVEHIVRSAMPTGDAPDGARQKVRLRKLAVPTSGV